MCVGDFFPMRTLCDAYHEEFESHKRSILDISVSYGSPCPPGEDSTDFHKLHIFYSFLRFYQGSEKTKALPCAIYLPAEQVQFSQLFRANHPQLIN